MCVWVPSLASTLLHNRHLKHAKYQQWRGTAIKALLYQQFLDSKVTLQHMSPHGINKEKLKKKQHTRS